MPSGVGLILSWSRRLVPIASMRDGFDDRTRDCMCLCARMLAWKPKWLAVNAALDAADRRNPEAEHPQKHWRNLATL